MTHRQHLVIAEEKQPRASPWGKNMITPEIEELVNRTWLVDTHEHLVEESTRLEGVGPLVPCQDFAYLFFFYVERDLASAGMPQGDIKKNSSRLTLIWMKSGVCSNPTMRKARTLGTFWRHGCP